MTDATIGQSTDIDRAEYHSALATGLVIGRYKILAVLGEGGFGITYRCHDTQLHRDVAIKEYLPSGLAIRQGDTQVLPRSTEVSKRLADEENLLTIPGDMFGAGQERFVRLAFANVADDRIPAVLERLERFGT